jgi:hypothetical protein
MRIVLAVFVVVAVVFAGCGGGGETDGQATGTSVEAGEASARAAPVEAAGDRERAERRRPAAEAPSSSATGSRNPDPAPRDDDRPASASVGDDPREVGESACQGMTPQEAAKHFELVARRSGVGKQFAAFVADPPPSVEASPGYPRLVAAVYAATLPAAQRADAAAGCAEELASAVRE